MCWTKRGVFREEPADLLAGGSNQRLLALRNNGSRGQPCSHVTPSGGLSTEVDLLEERNASRGVLSTIHRKLTELGLFDVINFIDQKMKNKYLTPVEANISSHLLEALLGC